MSNGSLPRRYARALIQLAQESNQVESFGQALEGLVSVFHGSPDMLKTLANDLIDFTQRLAAVEAIADQAKFPVYVKNFLCLLIRKERIGLLPDISREYQRFQDELLGIVRVLVEAPAKPEGPVLDRVASILSLKLKKKVVPSGLADPEMIGGMILKIDHVVYDGSIRRELELIKESMLKA